MLYAYTWLQNKLNEIENDSNLTTQQKEWFGQMYLRCFWRVRGYLFEIYIEEAEYSDARQLYADDTLTDAKVYLYSSYIFENDLVSARNYLNSIISDSEQMSDFITIQNINLNRLPYGPYYEASVAELDTVRAIALKSHPYAAYGKALHYALTGEVISSEIPDLFGEGIQQRINSNSSTNKKTSVYPNPFNNLLNIEVTGYEKVEVEVFDFFGRNVYSNITDQTDINISTENWKQGMYLITIKSEGESILTDKIMLLH